MITFDFILPIFEKFLFFAIGLCSLGFLIGFHELGHFLFCKLFNISTPSFSIGFGPRIFTKKIGETEFKLSAIPFGGYVEIAGASEVGQGEQTQAHSLASDSFATKPYWQKMFVMLGGILFNLLFAYVVFILLFMLGTPKSPLIYKITGVPVIENVLENKPAARAGIMKGDRITAINSIPVADSISTLLHEINNNIDKPVSLTIERNTIIKEYAVDTCPLGVEFKIPEGQKHSFGESIKLGIQATNQYILEVFNSFGHLFKQRNIGQMAGPLMIVKLSSSQAAQGFKSLLLFLIIISINLAVLNLIPLPILDGGQLLFYTIEAIIGRPLPVKVREYIHIATWLLFIVLFLYLTCSDILNILQPYVDIRSKVLHIFGMNK